MTDLEEVHTRATQANDHFIEAMRTFHNPLFQATEILQTLHEVIAAIDGIYLYLQNEQEEQTE